MAVASLSHLLTSWSASALAAPFWSDARLARTGLYRSSKERNSGKCVGVSVALTCPR